METLLSEYFSDISALRLSDAEETGGKGANMGELVAAGPPRSAGVCVDAQQLPGLDARGSMLEFAALHRDALTKIDDTGLSGIGRSRAASGRLRAVWGRVHH